MKMTGRSQPRAAAMITLAAFTGLLAACATMPPEVAFEPDNSPNRAALTIFRERQFENSAFTIQVRVDGQKVGELKSGSQINANAKPGDLKIAIQSEYDFRELVLPLQTQPGQDYYLDVLPRGVYLQQFAGGAFSPPKDKASTTACNSKWCITIVSADEAKARTPKAAG